MGTLTIGNNQGMGDVEYGKIYDIYFPPAYLRLFDGPSCSIIDMWRIFGRDMINGGLVVGTIIKPKLGLQPKPFEVAEKAGASAEERRLETDECQAATREPGRLQMH